jgi:hypothetical protein
VSTPDKNEQLEDPPGWAIERASAEMYDGHDQAAIIRRAWEIVRDVAERHSERHDEYDDPDQGGES